MWLLPSRGRPAKLSRFIEQYHKTNATTPITVLVDEEDPLLKEYEKLDYPPTFSLTAVGPTESEPIACIARANRTWLRSNMNKYLWIGLISDDMIPITSSWDLKLIHKLEGLNFVSSNDGWQAPRRFTGASVFSGDLIRAVGYIYPPKIMHMYLDDIWEKIGKKTNLWEVNMDVLVEHEHWDPGAKRQVPLDDTYHRANSFFGEDNITFQKWLHEDFDGVISRINRALEKRL